MLDSNFPSYHLRRAASSSIHSILYFSHNESDPVPEYVIKHPPPATSRNRFALALFDARNPSVLYAEVNVLPGAPSHPPPPPQPSSSSSTPSSSSSAGPGPLAPDSFDVLLYNPDQSVTVRRRAGFLARPDSWSFEMPERTFRLPSASQLDREEPCGGELADLVAPKIAFQWRRDSRLGRDLTCYMSGRSAGTGAAPAAGAAGGKVKGVKGVKVKAGGGGGGGKEPDIAVAMYRAGRKGEGSVTIYEPNMARVEVEDGKGLELVLLMSAVVVRDVYLWPGPDVFRTGPAGYVPAAAVGSASGWEVSMSGARGSLPRVDEVNKVKMNGVDAVDAETRQLREMVAAEERAERERKRRAWEEEEQTRRMLAMEEEELRRRREAEVERETERLRRQYGVPPRVPPGPPLGGPGPGPGGRYYGPPVIREEGLAAGPSLPPRQGMPKPQGRGLRASGSVLDLFSRRENGNKIKKKHSVLF